MSVLSNPAAASKGLCARFWKRANVVQVLPASVNMQSEDLAENE